MKERENYSFMVYPVVADDLGPSFSYVQEYIACLAEQTNPEGLPSASATLGQGKSPYQAVADLCLKLEQGNATGRP